MCSWRTVLLLLSAFTSTTVMAVTQYIPLQDRSLNHDIDKLVVIANLPTMRKPYNYAQIKQYLPKIKTNYPLLYQRLSSKLARYSREYALNYAQVTVALADTPETGIILSNARAETYASNYRLSAQAHYQPTSWLLGTVGFLAIDEPNNILPVDSYVAIGGDFLQLDIGYREHWLSPFHDSAMLLSTNARPSISVGISNPIAFTDFWDLHYGLFVSRLEHTDDIAWEDKKESGRPALMGVHLSVEPITGWTLAANRTFQFGGGSRPITLGSVWDAFWDPVSSDNFMEGCDSEYTNTCESGNQIASISSRINFTGDTPFSVYFEYAGEDTASASNTRLGNIAVSAGLFIPYMPEGFLGHNWSLTYEYSEWQDAWYVHHIYGEGYSNDGSIMGHWGGNNRVFNDGVGSQVQMLNLNYQTSDMHLEVIYRYLSNEDYGTGDYQSSHDLELAYLSHWQQQNYALRLYTGKTVFADNYLRAEFGLEW